MSTSTTIRSPGAIALGLFFAALTGYVLFEDVVRHGAAITTDHVMAFGVLVGTIASGHMFWHEARQCRIGSALGLALLFIAGTFYCVTASAGRNAEATLSKSSAVTKDNADRARAERDLSETKTRYDSALEAETKECGTGEGRLCAARRNTTLNRKADVEVYEDRLRALPPAQVENYGTKQTAKIIAMFVTASADVIEVRLLLLYPYVKASFCELATLLFLQIGLGRRRQTRQQSALADGLPTENDRRQTSFPVPADLETLPKLTAVAQRNPGNSGNGGGTKVYTKAEAAADLVTRLALGETVASQDDLADRWQVNKSTVSKWLKEWEGRELIPSRQQIGRCKRLTSA